MKMYEDQMKWAITKCHLMHSMAMRSAIENSTARGKFYDGWRALTPLVGAKTGENESHSSALVSAEMARISWPNCDLRVVLF